VSLEQASLGAQLGGQSFSELLVLRTADDVDALKAGRYTVGCNAGVVVLASWSMARSTDNSSSISRQCMTTRELILAGAQWNTGW
jgi:lipid-binding SYLF domain-containing protein